MRMGIKEIELLCSVWFILFNNFVPGLPSYTPPTQPNPPPPSPLCGGSPILSCWIVTYVIFAPYYNLVFSHLLMLTTVHETTVFDIQLC